MFVDIVCHARSTYLIRQLQNIECMNILTVNFLRVFRLLINILYVLRHPLMNTLRLTYLCNECTWLLSSVIKIRINNARIEPRKTYRLEELDRIGDTY